MIRLRRNLARTRAPLLVLCTLPLTAAADLHQLPRATDLQADAKTAAANRQVMLVAVTREGCPYCALLKRDILQPMLLNGDHDGKVLMRELMIEPESSVVDFAGRSTLSGRLAARYGVEITPTVLVLDHRGEALHPPIVGISNAEMYGFYLDQAIATASAGLATEPAGASIGE